MALCSERLCKLGKRIIQFVLLEIELSCLISVSLCLFIACVIEYQGVRVEPDSSAAENWTKFAITMFVLAQCMFIYRLACPARQKKLYPLEGPSFLHDLGHKSIAWATNQYTTKLMLHSVIMALKLLKTCLRESPTAVDELVAKLEAEKLKEIWIEKDMDEHIPVFHEDECPICRSEIDENEKEVLDCHHQFHKTCIFELIKHNNKCPKCRAHIHTCQTYMYILHICD